MTRNDSFAYVGLKTHDDTPYDDAIPKEFRAAPPPPPPFDVEPLRDDTPYDSAIPQEFRLVVADDPTEL